jgi:hypothetical protein
VARIELRHVSKRFGTDRRTDVTAVQVLRNIPVTAWVPLALVFFGIGNPPAIFLIGQHDPSQQRDAL